MDLKSKIRAVPDFPKKGILFYDITTLLQDPEYFAYAIKGMIGMCKDKKIDVIAAAESRGFIFGSIIAHEMKLPFVPLRKPGKLPYRKLKTMEYDKEYGQDGLEIHEDALKKGDKVMLVDDLLATGGTMKAVAELVERMGGEIVGMTFLIELGFLGGRKKLDRYNICSLMNFENEEWDPENKEPKEDFSSPDITN
ncbi:MAG: adenine phosphoribosyltransferase [Candidatus Aenigmarchaeota archaeon]|nr:adenine phosphoribosyltransferase [Candidatus Aenigmarchaeota archaeon]